MVTYTTASTNLCKAVDEVVDTGWKELHYLALKITQFERMFTGNFGQRVVEVMRPMEERLRKAGTDNALKADVRFIRIDEIFEVVSKSFVEDEMVMGEGGRGSEASTSSVANSVGGNVGSGEVEKKDKGKGRWSMFGGGRRSMGNKWSSITFLHTGS